MQRLSPLVLFPKPSATIAKAALGRYVSCLSSLAQTSSSGSRNDTGRQQSILQGIKYPSSLVQGVNLFLRRHITLLTSFNVVDNSKLGKKSRRYKKPYLIGFYQKRKTADIGDIIRVAVQGKTNKALVVGTRKPKSDSIPRYDNNNIVLVDDNLAPLGTRIRGPLPTILRKQREKYSKVLALASRFI